MAKDNKSKSMHKSSLVKKIGITFIIPIFLTVLGGLLICVVGWNYISSTIDLGKIIFSKPVVNLNQYSFEVNETQVPIPLNGEKFASLQIPSVNMNIDVYQGDDEGQISRGAGHNLYTTMPGQGGNCVLCAHRDGYFLPLQYVKNGDEVIIDTSYGTYYYEVDNIWIAEPDDMTVTAPAEEEKLTLYTCYPFDYLGSAPQRYIVECKFTKVDHKEG